MFLKKIKSPKFRYVYPLKNRKFSHLTTGFPENPGNLEGHPSTFIYDQGHSVIQFTKQLCWSHQLAVPFALQKNVTLVSLIKNSSAV